MLLELTSQLKSMRPYGMAATLTELGAERSRQSQAPEVWLKRLAEAVTADRQAGSLRYQLNVTSRTT